MSTSVSRTQSDRLQPWWLAMLLLVVVPALLVPAHAENKYRLSNTWSTPFADNDVRLTVEELDRYRGGFTTEGGFDFSLGLRNLHQINDAAVVEQTLFRINDVIDNITGGDTATSVTSAVPQRPAVIQLGPGNFVDPSLLAGGSGLPRTIIQNSLDQQVIRNTSVYDFQLSNVGALTRALNANVRRALVGQQLVDSIR